MKWSYYFKHWMTTVLLGSLAMLFFIEPNNSFFSITIELYLVFILFSTVLSFPTFTILAFVFHYFDDLEVEKKLVKGILISITVLGVILTQLISIKEISLEITFSYTVSAIISGMIYKLKRNTGK